eukprot:scaffold4002_cov85-Cylindrotheca_fusiformis.AAC.1
MTYDADDDDTMNGGNQRLFNAAQEGTGPPQIHRPRDDVNFFTRSELDKVLADSMAQLTVEEREGALDDLHGIPNRSEVAEDAVSINRLLEELDRNLNDIKKGTFYEQAERNNPSYVTSRDFRLMFLRASDYDPEASVKRIMNFLEIQKSLFGEEMLGKKVKLDDLDDEAIASLKSGALQISASADRAGRKILFVFPRALRMGSLQSELQARYYIMMALSDSEQVQKMGIVVVYYTLEKSEAAKGSRFYSGNLMKLPLRWAGVHICIGNWKAYCIGSVAIYCLPHSVLPKFRIHHGSDMECLYKLGSFGIPRDAVPLSAGGFQLDNRHHLEWCRHRKELERSQSSSVLDAVHSVIVPGPNDVLFGQFRSNAGNCALRKLASSLLDEYNSLTKTLKTRMAQGVIKEFGSLGGRFLKQNSSGEWEEASQVEALRKVAKTFRNCRRNDS